MVGMRFLGGSSHTPTAAAWRRRLAGRLLPPVVAERAQPVREPSPTELPEWDYVPEGWRAATRAKGWNVRAYVESERAKWPEFVRALEDGKPLGVAHEAQAISNGNRDAHNTVMAFGYLLGVAAAGRDRLSVLDWGGGLGHYYAFARTLRPDLTLDYHCFELPIVTEAGRSLLPEVTFHETAAEALARGYNLVFASGSLQYEEDWRGRLETLARSAAPYLYVTRLPLVNKAPSFVVLQRAYAYGYGTEYLGWFLNRDELLRHIRGLGLEVVREFLVDERASPAGAPEDGEYGGFLFRAAG
jgi:putative methyltransferase (TIGR04325 family)